MENNKSVNEEHHVVLDVHDRPSLAHWLPLSLQHLFAMLGATILVPLLVGMSPAVALVTSGAGTLVFLLITRGKVPAYLGSSFAFIAPLASVVGTEGIGQAMFGAIFAGVLYAVISLLIVAFGTGWLRRILPPVVIGPVIIVIGLGLAGVAADMAAVESLEDGTKVFNTTFLSIAMITLLITIIGSVFIRGFFGLIPVLLGIVGGYTASIFFGLVHFEPVAEAAWFAIPEFVAPKVSWTAVLVIMPVALVTLAEHIGDMSVISKIMNRDLLQKPGLHRTLFGDGMATIISSVLGGPPNTTYGENVGVLAISRVFSVFVVGGAAVLAIIFGFIGKIGALIQTLPVPVMGGVAILLFGIIASSGLRLLIDAQVSFAHKRNLVIASIILVIGIGTTLLQNQGLISLSGIAVATLAGMLLHLVLPGQEVSYGQKATFEEEK